MVYQPPAGARDLLPLDVLQKRWIEERLQQVFERWGYHPIVTSTIERLDTLMAGEAIERSTVVQVQSTDEGELGLRPELTASIARTAVTRLAQAPRPLRLYYSTNVFRKLLQGGSVRQQEFYQAGVELLGAGSMLADAETLLLLQDCLTSLELQALPHNAQISSIHNDAHPRYTIVLGEAAFTKSLLETFPDRLQGEIRQAIAQLDRLTLEALPLSPEQRQVALLLLDLRGEPTSVFQRLQAIPLSDEQRAIIHRLKTLLETMTSSLAAHNAPHITPDRTSVPSLPLILDLSLVRTFDYYTGLVFEVVCSTPTNQWVIAQGGRYDQLLGLYHPQGQTHPGIGFCLDIETLQQVLLKAGSLPHDPPRPHYLVVPQTAAAISAALAYAQTLKDTTPALDAKQTAPTTAQRIELYLGEDYSPEQVRSYAHHRQISQIAWVSTNEPPQLESL